MERYSLIVMTDETAPVRRFEVSKHIAKRVVSGVGFAALLLSIGLADYVRVRIDQLELDTLRAETAVQRETIESFDATLAGVEGKLARLRDLERKVRIIANLPGSAATGGTEVVELGTQTGGDLDEAAGHAVRLPLGVPSGAALPANDGEVTKPTAEAKPPARSGDDRISLLRLEAQRLGLVAESQEVSMLEVVEALEDKHDRLVSSPAIWPTKGWLTSRFGLRVSPFTGGRQFHAGIDIAGAKGTDVVAPGAGKIVFAGKKGPMGNAVIIDHGYGVRTHYGHSDKLLVKRGERVERGQVIAALGNTGRSTGPHLHYSVEVKGKSVNPLNYIFD